MNSQWTVACVYNQFCAPDSTLSVTCPKNNKNRKKKLTEENIKRTIKLKGDLYLGLNLLFLLRSIVFQFEISRIICAE